MNYEPCEHTFETCDACAVKQAEARIAELERLLTLAVGWLQDPSAFWGTNEATQFIRDLDTAMNGTEQT